MIFPFQSKAYQKADWEAGHKSICRNANDIRDIREQQGEEIALKHKSFEAWCTDTGSFPHAAVSAVGLHSDWKRIGELASRTPNLSLLTNTLTPRQLRFPRCKNHQCSKSDLVISMPVILSTRAYDHQYPQWSRSKNTYPRLSVE